MKFSPLPISSFSVPFSLSLTLAEEDLSFGVSVAVASSVCWLSVVATTDNQQTDEATATETPNDKSSSAKVSDKENGTENDDIGKGENFNGKKYLNYFGKQMTDILNGPVDEINARLIHNPYQKAHLILNLLVVR